MTSPRLLLVLWFVGLLLAFVTVRAVIDGDLRDVTEEGIPALLILGVAVLAPRSYVRRLTKPRT